MPPAAKWDSLSDKEGKRLLHISFHKRLTKITQDTFNLFLRHLNLISFIC
jgi:hypothetical protein